MEMVEPNREAAQLRELEHRETATAGRTDGVFHQCKINLCALSTETSGFVCYWNKESVVLIGYYVTLVYSGV